MVAVSHAAGGMKKDPAAAAAARWPWMRAVAEEAGGGCGLLQVVQQGRLRDVVGTDGIFWGPGSEMKM